MSALLFLLFFTSRQPSASSQEVSTLLEQAHFRESTRMLALRQAVEAGLEFTAKSRTCFLTGHFLPPNLRAHQMDFPSFKWYCLAKKHHPGPQLQPPLQKGGEYDPPGGGRRIHNLILTLTVS
ncbi:hypothetical protein L873DRAFT_1175919 [Choiromyces venosus 120613-1]|uniref:Uncharacterized protein n=1 Tax=Choiromyces venosus 120613-1 TaxID=1336337 RepID=A0A3N4K2P7_9PEZI|nr:hypothetical protein L873DRAFT_1175919 [Choiromyces venosus 120613-1]